MKDVWIAGAAFVFGWLVSKTRQDPACCGIGSWGGRCLSLAADDESPRLRLGTYLFLKKTGADAELPQLSADRGPAGKRRSVSVCQRVPAPTVGHFQGTHRNRDHCRASPRLGPLT